jgi:ketosteroid isomerase-like protein
MQKIPQAVAMVLLMSALSCPMCSAQASPNAKGATGPNTIMKTRGATEVEALLREFLSKVNDPAMHNRFWADDLIYVGAGGAVRTKAEIMKNVTEEAAKADPTKKDEGSFDAEDVKVRQYGDVCVLNFRLVAKSEGKTSYYRNSGMFVERDRKWQAVSWQATTEPEVSK